MEHCIVHIPSFSDVNISKFTPQSDPLTALRTVSDAEITTSLLQQNNNSTPLLRVAKVIAAKLNPEPSGWITIITIIQTYLALPPDSMQTWMFLPPSRNVNVLLYIQTLIRFENVVKTPQNLPKGMLLTYEPIPQKIMSVWPRLKSTPVKREVKGRLVLHRHLWHLTLQRKVVQRWPKRQIQKIWDQKWKWNGYKLGMQPQQWGRVQRPPYQKCEDACKISTTVELELGQSWHGQATHLTCLTERTPC